MTGRLSAAQRLAVYLPAALVVIIDQATKYLVQSSVPLYKSIPVIEGFFNITNVRNPGAAFGFLAQAGPAWRFFFLFAVTLAVMVAIIVFLERSGDAGKTLFASLALILGGAAGNLTDRIIHGEVIDFLDIYIKTWHWPAFNIADSAISVGAFLLILDLFLKKDTPS